ncbi:uncharacterized protein LTR77_009245 [Saxophila tyrrhenica]|uniref:Uncharacterized protein n=1 Tax=Saxophila tyrrhenica TaxID=1690608 RepID=A0AAV9NYI6_9PEZI|nr:hypothetical protein LTR77_009245 [Saxophila tyrrhenica]
MVLEEASTSTEPSTSFSDSSIPSSDLDPYSSSDNSQLAAPSSSYVRVNQPGVPPIDINIEQIPRPLLVPSFDTYAGSIASTVQQNAKLAAQVLQRPIRQDEAEAFAWHMGKALRIGSYGTPVGVSIATLFAYRSTGEGFRFPGWTPMKEGGRFSPDIFGPLKGQVARTAWQATRYGAYWTVGALLGQIFFGSYAITTSIAGRMQDPRLKDFLEALKKRQQEGGGMPRPRDVQNQGDGAKMGETQEMAWQRRRVQREADDATGQSARMGQQGQGGRGGADDDMSPTGGAFENELMGGPADTGLMDDQQARPDYGRGQQSSQYANNGAATDSSRPERRRPEDNNSRPSGTSWDRLRKDAMSGNQNQQSSNSRDSRSANSQSNSSGSDSFSFSNRDEDKQLARSQAQKEFDAQIEKERSGQDFDDGRGGRRKW